MNQIVDRIELQRRLAGTARPTLIEALPEKYYRDWHLPGALHLPHTEVRERAAAILPDKTADIVVYCASATCQNSHIAAKVLEQLGYTRVAVYAGGKQDWSEAGLPVERETLAA
jgi:rhodanese-related sulfurtransferase